MENVIYRHSMPTYLDEAATGTQCHIKRPTGLVEVYIQLGKEPDKPKWVFVDSFPDHLSDHKIKKLVEKRLLTQH